MSGTGFLQPGEKPACFNRPDFLTGREAQHGWSSDGARRVVWVPNNISTHCVQHDDMGAAKHFGWGCSGCLHYQPKESGE